MNSSCPGLTIQRQVLPVAAQVQVRDAGTQVCHHALDVFSAEAAPRDVQLLQAETGTQTD